MLLPKEVHPKRIIECINQNYKCINSVDMVMYNQSYAQMSGLKINFNKSSVVFLGRRNDFILSVLGCKEDYIPIRYLGISIKPGKLNKLDYNENLKTRAISFYHQVRGSQTSQPPHYTICTSSSYPSGLEKGSTGLGVGSYGKAQEKNYLVPWGQVCKPNKEGGLVIDLQAFNLALLTKWWWWLIACLQGTLSATRQVWTEKGDMSCRTKEFRLYLQRFVVVQHFIQVGQGQQYCFVVRLMVVIGLIRVFLSDTVRDGQDKDAVVTNYWHKKQRGPTSPLEGQELDDLRVAFGRVPPVK